MSTSDELKKNWINIKTKLKKKFAIITDTDLFLTGDKHEEMIRKLQLRLGKTREELNKLIAEL